MSAVLVFAYLLDLFGRRTRLPPVVLLILSGIGVRQVMDGLGLHLGWVNPLVPVIGTIGLILIVLEGALDLAVARERRRLIPARGRGHAGRRIRGRPRRLHAALPPRSWASNRCGGGLAAIALSP